MSNIKVDLKNSGYSRNEICEHSAVVEDINDELIVKTKNKEFFCGWINLPSKYKTLKSIIE